MIRLIFLFFFILLTNCILNNNSKFWNSSDNNYFINEKKKFETVEYDSNMSFEQFEIFIEDYAKNSNYPDISK